MRSEESQNRPVLVGYDAENLHKDEPYLVRKPIHGGNLNIKPYLLDNGEDDPMDDNESKLALDEFYSLHHCLDDLSKLISYSIRDYLKIPQENLCHFSCILIVPDMLNKTHTRNVVDMLFKELGFKSILLH